MKHIALALLVALPSLSYAQASLPPQTPSLGREVRNLGMGNVGVALMGNRASPFYNPAALNDLKEGNLTVFGLTSEFSYGSVELIGDTMDLIDNIDNVPDGPSADAEKTQLLDDFVQANVGEFQFFRVSMEIARYVRRNFAAGLMIDEKLDVSFRDQTITHFDIRNFADISPFFSGAYGFGDGMIQFGATLRPTFRFALNESDQQVSYEDVVGDNLSTQFENMKDPEFALGIDFGLKSNLDFFGLGETGVFKYLRPQVGFTWQDIGDPSFGPQEGNEQSISVGATVHPDFWKMKNAFSVDFRDLNQERDTLTKLNVGFEMQTPWFLALRIGMNQGYFAGGLGLKIPVFRLDVAYYGQEIGTYTRQGKSDRLAVLFAFDV